MGAIIAIAITIIVITVIMFVVIFKVVEHINNKLDFIVNKLTKVHNQLCDVDKYVHNSANLHNKDNVTINSNFNRLYNSIKGTNERIDNIHAEILVLKNKAEISFNNSKANNTTNKSRKFDNKLKIAKNGNTTAK